ncbi:MAG: hypothetical protein U0X74_06780 [Anaerolineales bacterium]|jgi:hypothetical protein
MNEKRKTASFLIRVWQEPSEWQPPGEWRVSARPMEGGGELLFRSAAELWRYLTDENTPNRKLQSSQKIKVQGEEEQ